MYSYSSIILLNRGFRLRMSVNFSGNNALILILKLLVSMSEYNLMQILDLVSLD